MTALAPTLESFLTERLMAQRGASPNTIASYRDTFRLLLRFAAQRTGKQPFQLDFSDLDAALIGAFLEHLEAVRENSVRTRNNRLSAIHSLFGYAALRHPEHAATIQRVLAIPIKLFDRKHVTYLSDDEVEALLASCDLGTWAGRRDQAPLDLAIEAGPRISELVALKCSDLTLGRGANLHVTGKGRKERLIPLGKGAAGLLRAWLPETRRHRTPPHAPPQTSGRHLPIATTKGSHHPLAQAHLRHASAGQGRSHRGHRAHSRPRGHRHHLCVLPPRRPARGRAGHLPRHFAQDETGTLSPSRPPPRVP
jgi:integrase/recombinase XerD